MLFRSRAARNRAGITTRSLQTLQQRPLLTGTAGWPNSVYRRKQIEHCLLLSSLMLRSSSAASAWCGGGPFGRAKSVAVMSATHFFVALACIPDLLKCAKHLFVAAMVAIVPAEAQE